MNRTKQARTPEEFAWLYACGCLENRHDAGTLTKEEYAKAITHLKNGTFPSPAEMRSWFPKPFARIEGKGTPCTLATMQNFWRVEHFDPGELSPVYSAQVSKVYNGKKGSKIFRAHNLAMHGEKSLVASNPHGYDVHEGTVVLIHGFVIAEILT